MEYKDSKTLQEAYQLIFEGKKPPCPCTIGKKCMKKECKCPKCVKALKESTDPNASAQGPIETNMAGEVPVHTQVGVDDPTIQAGMAILQRYASGEIKSLQAAQEFDELYKGTSQTPPVEATQG